MAKTPGERRAQRDRAAQARTNPDTGLPFRNYNALDTWQRNQRAQAKGFTSRAQERYRIEHTPTPPVSSSAPKINRHEGHTSHDLAVARRLPNSWRWYVANNGGIETTALAKKFNFAFGPVKDLDSEDKFMARAERERALGMNEAENWPMWRNDYDAIYG